MKHSIETKYCVKYKDELTYPTFIVTRIFFPYFSTNYLGNALPDFVIMIFQTLSSKLSYGSYPNRYFHTSNKTFSTISCIRQFVVPLNALVVNNPPFYYICSFIKHLFPYRRLPHYLFVRLLPIVSMFLLWQSNQIDRSLY